MKIDISRDSFSTLHDYTRVLLQQGRPILDADWNEQTAIVLHQLRSVTRAIYGAHGGPAGGQCGFIPFVADNELGFSNGYYTVDGLHLVCGADPTDANQPRCTYTHQKYCTQKDLATGTYLIYLEAMEREVTPAENPDLLDTALLGVDSGARGQAIWRILAEDWTESVSKFPPNTFCRDVMEKVNAEWLPEKIKRFASVTVPELDPHKPSGFPNQFFRYECHSVDSKSIWKYSGDNGFALFKMKAPVRPQQNKLSISIGTLRSWLPKKGDWVELLTEEQIRFGMPGVLCEIDEVRGNQEQTMDAIDRFDVHLKSPIPAGTAGEYLRVWNGRIESDVVDGIKPADYWQFAVRDTKPDGVTLRRPPRSYVPLGLVRTNPDKSICIISRFQHIALVPWREVDEELDCPKVAQPENASPPLAGAKPATQS